MTTYPIQEHPCTVLTNEMAASQYRHLMLRAPGAALLAQPGQFFNLLCPPDDHTQPFFRRPMSLYRLEREKQRLHFLYKVVGRGTRALARMRPGDELNVLGPLGQGFSLHPNWKTLLLAARGVGVATLAPLAEAARDQGRQVIALCSARTRATLLAVDYLHALGAVVHTVTDDDGSASMPAVEAFLQGVIVEEKVDALFTCGSKRLLRLMQKLGRDYDLPGQAALEQQMACGFGVCHGCVRPFLRHGRVVDLRVCVEGPVFDLQEVMTL